MASVAGVVALVVLTGMLWAVGGLRTAPEGPHVQPGRWVEGERLRIRPHAAQVTTQKPGGSSASQEGTQRYLVITADVENTADEAKLVSKLTLRAVTAHIRPGGTLTWKGFDTYSEGRSVDIMLQPDIPERVELLWALPPSAPTPREVTLAINDFVYREDFFSRRKSWKSVDDVIARVTMPVRGDRP